MPQTYRRQYSDYPPPSRISLEPRRRTSLALQEAQLTNADESIVLSDLIRTGEQSRLRRRGAMRLDHATGGGARPLSGTTLPPPIPLPASAPPPSRAPPAGIFTRPATPPWLIPYPPGEEELGSNGDWNWAVDEDEGPPGPGPATGEEQRRAGAESDDTEQSYILYCGGEETGSHSDYESGSGPYDPSPLPWGSSYTPAHRDACQSARHSSSSRKTNGCGAVVHVRAFPQKPRGVWVGKEEATDAVVGMDSTYFEHTVVARMMKSACGCVREGIGCAVCGNPLGTRYMPCQAASEGLFSNGSHGTPRSTRPLHPSGPRYWQAQRPTSSLTPSRSSSRSGTPRPSQGTFYVYTFFAAQVSSSPLCSFPPLPKAPERRGELMPLYGASPATTPRAAGTTWLGYTPAASPQPYSPTFAPPPPQPLPRARARSRSRSPISRGPRTSNLQLSLTIPMVRSPASLPVPVGNTASRAERAEGGELDADGVLIGDSDTLMEPNSPDKIGNEGMLWSGR